MKLDKSLYDKDFLKQFTLAAIGYVEAEKYHIEPGMEIIDADLIPELSRELVREYELNNLLLDELRRYNSTSQVVEEFESAIVTTPAPKPRRMMSTRAPPRGRSHPIKHDVATPHQSLPTGSVDTMNGYDKILPLLSDRSISRIQCFAPSKLLTIIRAGQRENTRIALSAEQITDIFERVSDLAHLPLIEGPIKIVLPEYTLEGINSTIANDRFIIQKQTAYSFLESGVGSRRPAGRR